MAFNQHRIGPKMRLENFRGINSVDGGFTLEKQSSGAFKPKF